MLDSPIFSENRSPLTLNILLGLVILAILSIFIMHAKSGVETSALAWSMGILTMFLFTAGWYILYKTPEAQTQDLTAPSVNKALSGGGLIVTSCGLLAGLLTSFMNGYGVGSYLILVLGFILLLLHRTTASNNEFADYILTPLLSSAVMLVSASAIGNPLIGVFPAVIVYLLVFVIQVTMNAESEIQRKYAESDEDTIFLAYRKRFAWTAGVFFLFGVVSFWPWLGMLYGDAYFWILALGNIVPLVFFWGRLRQPRSEGPLIALVRFNRISPVVVCILLIAFAIG